MTRTLALAVLSALLLGACDSSSSSLRVCQKEKECCSTVSRCEEINKEGPNWEERCEIDRESTAAKLLTYRLEVCDAIADRYLNLLDCMSNVSCTDIASDSPRGHIARCDLEAKEYCAALQASGDACGRDWSRISCDDFRSNIISD